MTAPGNYPLFVFGLASFVVGLPVSTTVVTVLALGVSLVVAPLLYWIPGVNYESTTAETVEVRPVTVDGLTTLGVGGFPEVIVASLVGVVVLVAGLHGVNLTARLFEAATVRLPGETTA